MCNNYIGNNKSYFFDCVGRCIVLRMVLKVKFWLVWKGSDCNFRIICVLYIIYDKFVDLCLIFYKYVIF